MNVICCSCGWCFKGYYNCVNCVKKKNMNRLGAGCVQLWICSAEPPGEHRYENRNNNINCVNNKTIKRF